MRKALGGKPSDVERLTPRFVFDKSTFEYGLKVRKNCPPFIRDEDVSLVCIGSVLSVERFARWLTPFRAECVRHGWYECTARRHW